MTGDERRTVLVVDDEVAIRESLAWALVRDGFRTREADSLRAAYDALDGADLVILDLILPDGSGLDLLTWLRARRTTPVIILTSRDGETDRVVGLELGADDYVAKPFSPREVVARVRAVLRRSAPVAPSASDELRGPGGLRLDSARRRAFVADRELSLSRTEFDVLAVLLRAPGRVLERGQLLAGAWPDATVGERTVDVHLKALRRKIAEVGGDPGVVETVRGVGYRLREDAE